MGIERYKAAGEKKDLIKRELRLMMNLVGQPTQAQGDWPQHKKGSFEGLRKGGDANRPLISLYPSFLRTLSFGKGLVFRGSYGACRVIRIVGGRRAARLSHAPPA